jgi:hypothetical protein
MVLAILPIVPPERKWSWYDKKPLKKISHIVERRDAKP